MAGVIWYIVIILAGNVEVKSCFMEMNDYYMMNSKKDNDGQGLMIESTLNYYYCYYGKLDQYLLNSADVDNVDVVNYYYYY